MPKARKRICVLAADISSNTVSLTIKGIMQKAYEYDYDVCVFAPLIKDSGKADYQYGEKNIYQLPNFEHFSGVIIVAESIKIEHAVEEIEERLKKVCDCPVVVLGRESENFESILIRDEETMELLVDHLIEEHGCSKINCLTGGKQDYHARNRLAGYKKSMEKHGLFVNESQYTYSECLLDSAVEYAYNIAHGLMDKPDAIVCFNDYVAVMMAKEFMIQGMDIPNDLIVAGFNSNDEGINFIPCITSTIPPCKSHGENAVVLLHNKMEQVNEPINTSVVGELAIGQSCGCKNDLHYEQRKREQEQHVGCFSEHYFSSNFMEENLTSAVTIEDCMVEINWYTYQLNKFKEFYICLIDDWDSYKRIETIMNPGCKMVDFRKKQVGEPDYIRDGYTEKMVLRAKNKDGIAKVVKETFAVSDMLPALYEERDYPTTYFFTPLHFKDRTLGYIAINFGKNIVTYDPYYHTWVRNIDNAIEIIRNQSELRYINERLNHLALYDELTGVYNRFGMDQVSGKLIGECRTSEKKLVLLVGDLDNLKGINDGYGHLEGDVAITAIADAFRESVDDEACIGRLGGDEFIVLLNGDYDEEGIVEIEDRIASALELFNEESGKEYKVDVSIGHYTGSIKGWTQSNTEILDCFLNNADKAMYANKNRKKMKRL